MNILNKYITQSDEGIQTRRLKYSHEDNALLQPRSSTTEPFLKGPVSWNWLSSAAKLPGKALHVALAIQWINGMSGGEPFKLTAKALDYVGVAEDAARDAINRLEAASLILVTRAPGQRPTIKVLQGERKAQQVVASKSPDHDSYS